MKFLRSFPIIVALALPTTVLADDDEPRKTAKRDAMNDKASRVQAHVIPAIAGIQSADKAAAVLYELSGGDQLRHRDAQTAIDLAKQALAFALDRAAALDDLEGLSQGAESEVDRAQRKLREARMTLRKLDQNVAKKQARVSRNQAKEIREDAKDLHEDLVEAEKAIEQVARAYDVPTDLEFRS